MTHIDQRAVEAVGRLYAELDADTGDVLDLMSSWTSHLVRAPRGLCVLGMNREELQANETATARVVQDLNQDPLLPFPDARFDSVLCCVSVDYLTRPLQVFNEVGRVLRPGGIFLCTFSNRMFPTKAIRGWLYATDDERVRTVEEYFRLTGPWHRVQSRICIRPDREGDPLYAVWAERSGTAVVDVGGRPLTG